MTPCSKNCRLNSDDLCIGCGRTREELTDWLAMTNDQKRLAMGKAKLRLETILKEQTNDRKPYHTSL
jgi:predicted Fe-S protein YdhL (DUF1289 family)